MSTAFVILISLAGSTQHVADALSSSLRGRSQDGRLSAATGANGGSSWSGCHSTGEWKPKGNLQFIHVPRNMGTSIENCDGAFPKEWNQTRWETRYKKILQTEGRWKGNMKARYESLPQLYSDPRRRESTRCFVQHVPPASLSYELPGNKVFEYGKNQNFCVVRNPYERLISQFGFATTHYKEKWGFSYKCNKKDINAYLFDRLEQIHRGRRNATGLSNPRMSDEDEKKVGQNAPLLPEGAIGPITTKLTNFEDCHFLPESFFVYGFDAKKWKVNTNEKWCDHVLRYENLSTEFNQLMEDFGYGVRFQKGNKTTDAHLPTMGECAELSEKDFTPELLALVHDIYAEDFKLFGYPLYKGSGK